MDEPGSAGSEIRRGIGGDPVDVHYGAERVVKRKIGGDTTTPSAATPRAGTPENPPSSTALREDGDHYIRDGTTTAARDQVERDSNKKRPTDPPRQGRRAQPPPQQRGAGRGGEGGEEEQK